MLTETVRGTWMIHDPDQPPVEGVAVHRYRYGLLCEVHGRTCVHVGQVDEALWKEGGDNDESRNDCNGTS